MHRTWIDSHVTADAGKILPRKGRIGFVIEFENAIQLVGTLYSE